MAGISSLGVGSGLDLGSLVTNLVNTERAPVESRLNRLESNLAFDLSGIGQMRSSLSQFQKSSSSPTIFICHMFFVNLLFINIYFS